MRGRLHVSLRRVRKPTVRRSKLTGWGAEVNDDQRGTLLDFLSAHFGLGT
jgi:hypothetical protein